VAIARAVVRKPPILLCDEPTGELDEENGRRVLTLLREMNRNLGTTILVVTHNNAIAEMADLVVRMHSGTVVSAVASAAPVEPASLRW
jgi:putative ABC transport system ATP-binding protein